MTSEQHALWQRLQLHPLDDPHAAKPFSLRLAKENAWAPGYTRRAMDEYLRYAFLATAAGHPVAPSDAVDQVWHLHLLHTRDYWEVFCPCVLGAPFHHGPARGGRAEQRKFGDWYARTLASYRKFFGEPPPDIWPEPAVHPRAVRVAVDRHWIIRKPDRLIAIIAAIRGVPRRLRSFRNWVRPGAAPLSTGKPSVVAERKMSACGGAGLTALLIVAGLLIPLIAHGATPGTKSGASPLDWAGPDFLVFYLTAAAGLFMAAAWMRIRLRGEAAPLAQVGELEAYELGMLADGHGRAFLAAVVNLHHLGHVVVKDGSISRGSVRLEAGQPVLERVIVGECTMNGTPISTVRAAAQDALDAIESSLAERGLVISRQSGAHYPALVVALLVPLLGSVKILIGIDRQKPVGILVLLVLAATVVAVWGFARRPRLSRQGREFLHRVEEEKSNLRSWNSDSPATLPVAVGLFGLGVLTCTPLADVMFGLRRVPTGASSSTGSCGGSSCSSGGGDSGGGGGDGGGGGCGGCGGGGD